MLRIVQSTSRSRAKSYFSTADYYSEGQELVGQWRGRGAAMLGLAGIIAKSEWEALCDNVRPDTGTPLTVRRRTERRVGWDFNFHVPKGVSLLYGLTRDDRILDAFRDSVRATMDEMEVEAATRVRRSGADEDRATGNLVWGEYIHRTSRPVDGEPDPHLHAHCFVFNATYDADEERWKAAQIASIKRDSPYWQAVFHATFARKLQELGLETHRTRTGWDLAGLSKATLDRFSRRTAQVEAAARKLGVTDPVAKAELGAKTRERKDNTLSMSELAVAWRDRLDAQEQGAIDAMVAKVGGPAILEQDVVADTSAERAVEHLFERSSVAPERKVLAEAFRQGVGAASRHAVERAVDALPLVRAKRDGRIMVTTPEVLREEADMLAFARDGRGTCRPIDLGPVSFPREKFNDEQKRAVLHVLTSKDRVVIVRGAAGAGKTSMMKVARDAMERAGVRVHAFAPSAGASRGVLRKDGFDSAETVARLLADDKLQEEVAGGVLWIDEAGLLGTKTMRDVFKLAQRIDARVVLSGDKRQHGSVERGAALRLLEDEAGLKPAEITEIQRQRDRYKDAVKRLSEGRVAEGFRRLDKLGWIREVAEDDPHKPLVDAYLDAVDHRKETLVISPTHAEAERVTAAIRDAMRMRGSLGKYAHVVPQLVSANLTVAERRDPASYEPGDVLVFHQNAVGFKKGTRVEVTGRSLPLDQAERFTVYRPRRIELARGDRLRIAKNGTTADGRHRLDNGDLFTVKGFAPNGDLLVFKEGRGKDATERHPWTIASDYGHLAYGLVLTSHASQGKTVDVVLISQSALSFPASSQQQFYVSASRAREQALVFTDDKEGLLEAVSRSDERLSGSELVRGARTIHHEHHRRLSREQEREIEAPRARVAEVEYDR